MCCLINIKDWAKRDPMKIQNWRKFKSLTLEYVLNKLKMGTDHLKDKCYVNVTPIFNCIFKTHSRYTYPSNGPSPSLLYLKHILKWRIWIFFTFRFAWTFLGFVSHPQVAKVILM